MSHVRHVGHQGVSADLSPSPPRATTSLETLVVFAVCAAIAFPRGGSAAFHGVLWAEDGAVFLQGAYAGHGWHDLLTPYQGYALVVPRLITSVVSYLPIGLHGFLVNAASALIQAGVAVFAFHVVRSHARGRIAALIVAAGVAAVPVGPEAVDNVSNLQWFLLFGACLAALWEPRSAAGRLASVAVLCAAVTTSPFGVMAVLVVAVTWFVHRRKDLLVLLVAGLAALLVQVVVMIGAPPREIPVTPQWNPFAILDEYVRRVPGDGILGLGRYSATATSSALLPGVVVMAAVVLLSVRVARTAGSGALLVPAVVLALSGLTFAAPTFLSNITGALPPVIGGRYSVAPVLLFYVVIGLLTERVVLSTSLGASALATGRYDRGVGIAARVAAVSLTLALAFGLVSSWSEPQALRRDVPSWSSQVAHGRAVCSRAAGRRQVALAIAPTGWRVLMPCARLAGGR